MPLDVKCINRILRILIAAAKSAMKISGSKLEIEIVRFPLSIMYLYRPSQGRKKREAKVAKTETFKWRATSARINFRWKTAGERANFLRSAKFSSAFQRIVHFHHFHFQLSISD